MVMPCSSGIFYCDHKTLSKRSQSISITFFPMSIFRRSPVRGKLPSNHNLTITHSSKAYSTSATRSSIFPVASRIWKSMWRGTKTIPPTPNTTAPAKDSV